MFRSKRLTPIHKIAESKEKKAARVFGQSLELQKAQQQKLEQLSQYRLEYLASMAQKTQIGMSGVQLHQYHQFLNKLDLAIQQQNRVIQQGEVQIEKCREEWTEKNGRAKAISRVIENLKSKETQVNNKKEAKQCDEMSTQAFIKRLLTSQS